ncbi:MAG: glycosyltransferase family 1 protein [Fimbriimonadaceae bacterium]|nr:glycosyltransferase family 1 protein [Fimbriimonadaceae bacterium]
MSSHAKAELFHRETGGVFFARRYDQAVWEQIKGRDFDILWVDHGEFTSPWLLRRVRDKGMKSVLFNVDDGFGWRDRLLWTTFKRAIKEYDLVAVRRQPNVGEALARGARDAMFVWRPADEIAHRRRDFTEEELAPYRSDVLFLGTWMKGRGAFLNELIRLGVPLTIVGGRWNKAPEFEDLKPYVRSGHTKSDDEYAKWVQAAKICIGLLSHGNRDLHTGRSIEVPMLGTVLCAERTTEHLELYCEGVEAVFWDDAAECAQKCKELLADPGRLAAMADAGLRRVYENKTLNEPILAKILDRALHGDTSAAKR